MSECLVCPTLRFTLLLHKMKEDRKWLSDYCKHCRSYTFLGSIFSYYWPRICKIIGCYSKNVKFIVINWTYFKCDVISWELNMISLLSSKSYIPPAVLQLYRYHSLAFPHLHRRGHAIPRPVEFSGPWPSPSSVLQRHVLRITPSPGPIQPGLLHEQLGHHGARP